MTDVLEIVLEEVRGLKAAVVDLDHSIRGNGAPGLKSRVTDLEREMEQQRRRAVRAWHVVGAGSLAALPLAWEIAKRKWGWF